MRNIFFSYSNQDKEAATKIVEGLKLADHKVWFAPDNLIGGDFYARSIEEDIPECDIFVLLASKHSIGNKSLKVEASKEVLNEISLAKRYGLKIVPLNLDDSLKSGASGGNEYLLINMQFIEINAALASGNFTSVVKEIIAAADKAHVKSQDDEYLEQAERDLILGYPEQSIKALGQHSFSEKNIPRAEFVKALASITHKGLNSLSISDADGYTSKFEKLRHSNMAAASAYMLAVLKRYCYEPKSFKNNIEDLSSLKHSIKNSKPIDVKYRFLVEKLLPENNQFAVNWLI